MIEILLQEKRLVFLPPPPPQYTYCFMHVWLTDGLEKWIPLFQYLTPDELARGCVSCPIVPCPLAALRTVYCIVYPLALAPSGCATKYEQIYLVYHSVCPLVKLGLLHPLSRMRVCPSPRNRGKGGTLARM